MEANPKLSTPEEELAYLREQVMRKEAELAERGAVPERVQIVSETIHEHHAAPIKILAKEYRLSAATLKGEAEAIMAELNLGGSEEAVKSLGRTLEEKGIKNALAVMEKLQNPRVADDFHRYLVRHVASGLSAQGLDEKVPQFKALRMTLYEISLPAPGARNPEGRSKTLKELISG